MPPPPLPSFLSLGELLAVPSPPMNAMPSSHASIPLLPASPKIEPQPSLALPNEADSLRAELQSLEEDVKTAQQNLIALSAQHAKATAQCSKCSGSALLACLHVSVAQFLLVEVYRNFEHGNCCTPGDRSQCHCRSSTSMPIYLFMFLLFLCQS
jgi:hypothetical protein